MQAFTNIVKHARATEVSVTLNHDAHHFVLLLVDNGRGVSSRNSAQVEPSLDSLRSSSGNGLLNMQKRMQEIGGSCEWDSTPGEGTRVTLNTPFNHDITR